MGELGFIVGLSGVEQKKRGRRVNPNAILCVLHSMDETKWAVVGVGRVTVLVVAANQSIGEGERCSGGGDANGGDGTGEGSRNDTGDEGSDTSGGGDDGGRDESDVRGRGRSGDGCIDGCEDGDHG